MRARCQQIEAIEPNTDEVGSEAKDPDDQRVESKTDQGAFN